MHKIGGLNGTRMNPVNLRGTWGVYARYHNIGIVVIGTWDTVMDLDARGFGGLENARGLEFLSGDGYQRMQRYKLMQRIESLRKRLPDAIPECDD